MYYGGIDAHRSYLTIAITDSQGRVVQEYGRVPSDGGESLLEALADYRPLEVAVETCSFWSWIYDVLEPTEVGFHLVHAKDVADTAKAKTDSVDALQLARLLAGNLVTEVHAKPIEQRRISQLVRHRAALVRERSRLLCRIHCQLHQRGLELARDRLQTEDGRRWLREEAWPWLSEEQQALVETHLELIDLLTFQIGPLDEQIRKRAREHPAATLLQSIPGIGPYRSLLLVAELLPIRRFPSPAHLVSYAGLAPRTRSSGGKTRYGSTPQAANRWVRGELVSAIPSHMRSTPDSSLGTYYKRQKERIGWQKARVAAARKLCRAIHAMLSTGELWRGGSEQPSGGQG